MRLSALLLGTFGILGFSSFSCVRGEVGMDPEAQEGSLLAREEGSLSSDDDIASDNGALIEREGDSEVAAALTERNPPIPVRRPDPCARWGGAGARCVPGSRTNCSVFAVVGGGCACLVIPCPPPSTRCPGSVACRP